MDEGGCPDAKDAGAQQGKNVCDRPPAEANRRCNSSARIQARRFFPGGSRKEKRGVIVYLLVHNPERKKQRCRSHEGVQGAGRLELSQRPSLLAAAAVMFLPGVMVEAEGPVAPSSSYPISFRIANANFIPLTNVNPYLVICYAVAAPAASLAIRIFVPALLKVALTITGQLRSGPRPIGTINPIRVQ